jgi:transcriptional regulator with GAF, ATPase, and Fis domain
VSVLDQFRDAEQRVAQRMKELEPAVDEYRELAAVAQRLGIASATADRAAPRSARKSTSRRASRTPAKRTAGEGNAASAAPPAGRRSRRSAAPGQREQLLLALVRERPGVTVAEAGKELSVDPTGLYRVVRRLEQRGELRKNGRSLEPAGATS